MLQLADTVDHEQALVEKMMSFVHDPLGYVLYAFPWDDPKSVI